MSELGKAQQAAQKTTHHEGYPDGSQRHGEPVGRVARDEALEGASEQVAPEAHTMVVDVNGCARCQSEAHPALQFAPLTHPVEAGLQADEHGAAQEAPPYTHWAPCPVNGEPILLRSADLPEAPAPVEPDPATA